MRVWWVIAAAINGVLAVTAGTVSAHLLAGDPRRARLLGIGAQYAMYHALALIGLCALAVAMGRGRRTPWLAAAGWLFVLGTVLFSGSLYLLALTEQGFWGLITPFGGTAFLAGWIALGVAAWRELQRR